ncbi:MAG: peptidylprolyl isomerase [Candidatus Cryptobacteroides sp.]|nr:peptidylprolyl isomerase [Candidatus Cryptobacteroides sp.]
MKIEKNAVVALTYELNVDGQIADKCTAERPLSFIQGLGYLLPKFEEAIAGLSAGDKFAFTLSPADGYGEVDPERIIDLPIAAFTDPEGKIRHDLLIEGSAITLVNQFGQPVPAKILKVSSDTVKVDVNHPMAGKTLNFSGEIVEVRAATEKELKEGLHGELAGGCSGCGGHCGEGECEGCGSEGGCEGGCGSCGE